MGDLISRYYLIERCKEIAANDWNKRVSPVSWSDAYEQFADDVEAEPSVDAVEVVRCKDCKHYDSHGYKICKLHSVEASQFGSGENIYMERDDFCSYGERSGEEDGK